MNIGDCNEVGSVFSVEVFKVGDVLEVVSIFFAAFNNVVGNDIVGVFLYNEFDIFFCKDFFCNFKDFSVGSGGRCV